MGRRPTHEPRRTGAERHFESRCRSGSQCPEPVSLALRCLDTDVLAGGWALGDDPVLRYILVALGAMPSLLAMGTATYLLLQDRDRLQSEEFVLRQLALKITERKGLPFPAPDIDVVDEERETTFPREEK